MITAYVPESRKVALVIVTNMYADGSLGTIRYESQERAAVCRTSVQAMESESKVEVAEGIDEMLALWFRVFPA